MVNYILFTLVLLLWAIYAVIGCICSFKLAKHIKYEKGFLKLWNVTQLSVISIGKVDYTLNDKRSKEMFDSLKKVIIVFYSVFIPLSFVMFISVFFENMSK